MVGLTCLHTPLFARVIRVERQILRIESRYTDGARCSTLEEESVPVTVCLEHNNIYRQRSILDDPQIILEVTTAI